MIHPTNLLRNTSDEQESVFSVPTSAVPIQPIDCGIIKLPCLNNLCKLEKFARPKVFLFMLGLLSFLQGFLTSYLAGTALVWTKQYNISKTEAEWIIYGSDIFLGCSALLIGYWGNRIHRPSWIGGLTILQAIGCMTLIIPELYSKNLSAGNVTTEIPLCQRGSIRTLQEGDTEKNYIALSTFFIYQLLNAFALVSLFTHGLTYVQDNVKPKNVPANFCVVAATYQIGKQIGMYSTWSSFEHFAPYIFTTPAWLVIASLVFILGIIIAMFPHSLPSVVMQQAVESILVLANGAQEPEEDKESEEFWTTLFRLIKNKILLLNIYASVFIVGAVINFEILEDEYYQSRFHVFSSEDKSGYQDPWLAQIITNLIKRPFTALAIMASGMIMTRLKPTLRKIAVFNLATTIKAALLYLGYAFFECDQTIHSEYGKISMYCSYDCNCQEHELFYPVCTVNNSRTFFSPCYAGCTSYQDYNGIKIFNDCSCSSDYSSTTSATYGPCEANSCNFFWGLAQVDGVLVSVALAATIIPSILINVKCVLKSDKAMALALQATMVGILPYVPLRFIYSSFQDYFCLYQNPDKTCKLHSSGLGTFVSITTVVLIVFAIILLWLVVHFSKDFEAKHGISSSNREGSASPTEESRGTRHRENRVIHLEDSDIEYREVDDDSENSQGRDRYLESTI